MSRNFDPYNLSSLVQNLLSSQPYGPTERTEPTLGRPTTGVDPGPQVGSPGAPVTDPNAPVVSNWPVNRTGESRGLDTFQNPQPPTTEAQKRQAANAKRARAEGEKGVEDAIRPGQIEPEAGVEPAISRGPLGEGIDKAVTQAWIDNMRRLREAKKGGPDKPPPKFGEHLIGQRPFVTDEHGNEIPTPPITAENLETYLRTGRTDGGVDPRAGPAGEDAVRQALTNMPMKELIDHALAVQEAQRRAEAIRQAIEWQMKNNPPPVMPESQFPENQNRPPGEYSSQVTAHDYSMLPETFPGVRGVGMGPMTGGKPPPSPPPANVIPGSAPSMIFGPRRTNPDQPHFPVGIDPNLSPPPPPVE